MKKPLLSSLFAALALSLLLPLQASAGSPKGISLTKEQFLEIVRHPPGRETWAKMDGDLVHRRKGSDDVEAPLHLGMLFTPARTIAQVTVKGSETYNVGQSYDASSPDAATVSMSSGPKDGGKPLLSEIGLRPQDLTMGFLFWNAKDELPGASVKGQDCRVFLLEGKGESARAYISAEYFFPLKVEWLKPGESAPYRTLEVDSFKKESDFWIVSSLILYGPGWKTKIEFSKTAAGFSKDGIPNDLFFVEPKGN